jgi:hypothetical protein
MKDPRLCSLPRVSLIRFFAVLFGKTNAAPTIAAHLAGKTTFAGMLFEKQDVLFRHIDFAFNSWKGNERHLNVSSLTLYH